MTTPVIYPQSISIAVNEDLSGAINILPFGHTTVMNTVTVPVIVAVGVSVDVTVVPVRGCV